VHHAAELATKQRYRQDGYVLLNGSIEWTDRSGKYSLAVFGRNLTDKRYYSLYSNSAPGGDYAIYAPPRIIGVRGKVNF